MSSLSRFRSCFRFPMCGLLIAVCLGMAPTVAGDNGTLYVKKSSWPQTMVATREVYLAHLVEDAAVEKRLPKLWKQIQADFPTASARFVQDMRRGQHLAFFAKRDSTQLERQLIQRSVGNSGDSRALLHQQLQELVTGAVRNQDARWLELYRRTCWVSGCQQELARIWVFELRQGFGDQLRSLLAAKAADGDRRWVDLQSALRKTANAMPPGRGTTVIGIGRAIRELDEHYASHIEGGQQLLTQWEAHVARWQGVFDAVMARDQSRLADLAATCAEVQALQRSLVQALQRMPQFLQTSGNRQLELEWEREYGTLESDVASGSHFARVASEVYRSESLIMDSDRDPLDVVLRRTAALLSDLRRSNEPAQHAQYVTRLKKLQEAGESILPDVTEARRVLFADACRLRREIALSNPLLDFSDILFVKHHRSLFNHMCDQYYGMAAAPGGGLYILADAFGPDPKVIDVLEQSVVEAPSRLAGQRLRGGPLLQPTMSFDGQGNRRGVEGQGGTFLSPDLSYDGKRILFAYVENTGDMLHRHHVDPSQGHWDEGRCYHVFSVNIDGTELTQLTDGTWNDFDPCWLPNGRVVFVSERRGGYLRCGRVCPTYTLFDMAFDGSDIQCLSFHETNEWHPSVTNDGMIIWTRWDYIDRHGCTAHMPWLTSLDGRDPRPVHGNYSPRPTRPDMEVDCRAIPDSHKFIATAAPHHGQAYGSLILIDPHVADDDGMGPVRRVTPEVGFPETQGGGQVYGTPWPLSEDYYLCVYDDGMRPGGGRQGGAFLRGDYGIYLVDAFGNRELLYRDPEIASLSPIPVRVRPIPPAPTELAHRGLGINPTTRATESTDGEEPSGTVAVMNVYESLLPWPADTRIKALRVLQVFPMSVPSGRPPHDTGLRVAGAGDSVVPVRHVLGTVPVEADGSAYFQVPANKELFFQALDEHGLAVQSMRSATHVREGERLVCAGCHNPRHQSTAPTDSVPLALQRKPSQLEADVDGSRPFSYPRLVQPVLDQHCVKCHAENLDTAPNLAREPIARNWYASYNSLIQEFGFHDYQDGYRTTPGRFGARASKLYKLLQDGHYDVELDEQELHRFTLWLDCASMFYGVYEKEGGQAQLRGGVAYPTLE